jgi:hypothetical protein
MTGLVVGLSTKLIPSGKVGSEEAISPKTGLIVGTAPVTFVEVRVFIVLPEYRSRRTVVTPTDAVLATAAIVTAAIIILVATAKAATVAAAIDPSPAATDDPADAAA